MNHVYLSGFGNEFASEAVAGALPLRGNSPQRPPHGLYPEQLSGTAFTVGRHENQRSWLYRLRPSVRHTGRFTRLEVGNWRSAPVTEQAPTPEQLRWDPMPFPKSPTDFVDGVVTMACSGDLRAQTGVAAHWYAATRSMDDRFFYNADGDILFVPQEGRLGLRTEFGWLEVAPGEIAVIQRGIVFQVQLLDGRARGYLCENYGLPFRLPDLGPIGTTGLAHPRHFLYPSASFEDRKGSFRLTSKYLGGLWECPTDHSPLDVVGWHGNYAPYKYDLSLFNTINTVSFDHPDPSIFTVLTSPSGLPGTANVDFVIFPPRWMVAEDTFRPPYFHRNVMSEIMGLVQGVYDAKESGGFVPGGASLHNVMSAHGPDAGSFQKATDSELKPVYLKDTMAFMFESRLPYYPTSFAMQGGLLQKNYIDCWRGYESNATF